jgi:hypothetical protein
MTTLVDCPQSDTGQWSFWLFGTTVRVEFWFWVTLLILGSLSLVAAHPITSPRPHVSRSQNLANRPGASAYCQPPFITNQRGTR